MTVAIVAAVALATTQACDSEPEVPPQPLVRLEGGSLSVLLEELPHHDAPCLTVRVRDDDERAPALGSHATAYCPDTEFSVAAVSNQQAGSAYLAVGFVGNVEIVSLADESGNRRDFVAVNRGSYGVALAEDIDGTVQVEAVVDGRNVTLTVAPGDVAVVGPDGE